MADLTTTDMTLQSSAAPVPFSSQVSNSANSLMAQLEQKINAKGVSSSLKSDLIQSRDSLQSILDSAFTTSGIINQSQLDAINATFANTKKQLLMAQSQQTTKNLLIYGGIALVAIGGTMWYIKRKKA